ncbi:MAG: Ger(x)C family spore germination protein [Firmicutes bacterium]|nr:Ger(x)C family spore germination protein [Bacillota bacterium]
MLRTLVLTISISTLLTGCWDRVELTDRLYPLAIAIDTAEEEPPKSLEPQLGLRFPDEKDKRLQQMSPEKQQFEMHEKYTVTLEIPIFKELVKNGGGPGGGGGGGAGGGGGGKPAWLLASTGVPIGTVLEQIETRSFRPISFGHLKVIIIGEKAARLGIEEYLAFFRRQHEIDRKTKVAIARGEAKDILSVDVAIDRLVGLSLNKIIGSRNTNRTIPMDIGKASTYLSAKRSFVLPRVIPGKRDLKVAGLAVFQGDKMVGWLGEEETQGLLLVTGKDVTGTIAIGHLPDMHGEATYRITRARSLINATIKGGKIRFGIRLRLNGLLEEVESDTTVDPGRIKELQEAIAKAVRERAVLVIKKTQGDFKADVFGLGRHLAIKYPRTWEKIKDRWDQIYPSVEINIEEVSARIQSPGLRR